jgi:hypothetical protein
MLKMIVFTSEHVTAGTAAYVAAKAVAARMAEVYRGRVEWRDDYNDYSVRGCFVVRA